MCRLYFGPHVITISERSLDRLVILSRSYAIPFNLETQNIRQKAQRSLTKYNILAYHIVSVEHGPVSSRHKLLQHAQLIGLFRYILRTPAACSRTFSSFCLLLPATAHFRFPFGPSDTVRATSSTTNCPVNPEAPKITR